MSNLEKILIKFGEKWAEAENNCYLDYTRKRQRQLLKRVIKKIISHTLNTCNETAN